MPYALTPTQRLAAHVLLMAKMRHIQVAEEIKCSIQQVKKMSSNLRKYGNVVAPPMMKRGRPTLLDSEMRAVSFAHLLY